MQGFTALFAYANSPNDIGETIEFALRQIQIKFSNISISSWKSLDIIGHFISTEVLSKIEDCDALVADISVLNFNVVYEIGYAIGKGKRVLLVRNISFDQETTLHREVGIFDTLGYKEYTNSDELSECICNSSNLEPIDIASPLNLRAPVYLLDTKHKTDWATRIVARIKKARYIYRSFDPNESPRLSAFDAISQVAQSYGVVVPLLSSDTDGFSVHNMRGAFIAGLADGMNKALCILQKGDEPVPLDYRDLTNYSYHLDDVKEIIADFAGRVAEAFQERVDTQITSKKTLLQKLDLGASSAENEMRTLHNYYLNTDQFLRSLRGEVHLVIGRKGSGKSAVFLQIRDKERSRNRSQNIVLDLKPEGYKLVKFKEVMLSFLEEGTFQHTVTAFWEYVLLLEVCYKILEKDKKRHLNDHLLYDLYRKIADLYDVRKYHSEGDFSERLTFLIENIQSNFQDSYGDHTEVRLSSAEVTELLYQHDVRSLEKLIMEYMRHKGVLWLLFDNIDKGWPTSGLVHEDLIIIRSLIDATRKIERQFGKQNLDVFTIVFLRNDVYELLVKETSDRGKEASVILDWTDSDLLRELLRLRIVSNDFDESMTFDELWRKLCVSHYKGEETSQFLIERSLMRPRFLLNVISQCKSFAVNLKHHLILEDDIKKGVEAYSIDLVTDIGYEISDIEPQAEDILYAFIDSKANLNKDSILSLLNNYGLKESITEKVFDLLLWYGFLGIRRGLEDTKYIYDLNYNMKLLLGMTKRNSEAAIYEIHPAFRPALMIGSN
ncbi:MAG: hypothetical protein AB2803_05280 [Candidatus Thiodiazotropha sp.]